MNNKGFAISGILYSILILFLILLLSLLHVLVVRINRLTSLVNEVNNAVEDVGCASSDTSCSDRVVYDTNVSDSDTLYTTKVRGKYVLKINDSSECYMYLPKNITLVIDGNKIKYIKPDGSGVIDVNNGVKNDIVGYNCGSNISKFRVTKIYSSFYND